VAESMPETVLAALLIFSKNDIVEVGNDFSLKRTSIPGFGIDSDLGGAAFENGIPEVMDIDTDSVGLTGNWAGADICLGFSCGALKKIAQTKKPISPNKIKIPTAIILTLIVLIILFNELVN